MLAGIGKMALRGQITKLVHSIGQFLTTENNNQGRNNYLIIYPITQSNLIYMNRKIKVQLSFPNVVNLASFKQYIF